MKKIRYAGAPRVRSPTTGPRPFPAKGVALMKLALLNEIRIGPPQPESTELPCEVHKVVEEIGLNNCLMWLHSLQCSLFVCEPTAEYSGRGKRPFTLSKRHNRFDSGGRDRKSPRTMRRDAFMQRFARGRVDLLCSYSCLAVLVQKIEVLEGWPLRPVDTIRDALRRAALN